MLTAALSMALIAVCSSTGQAQSQSAMHEQAARDFKSADAKLNAVYKRLAARTDKQSMVKLKKAQAAWIAFRDAQASLHATLIARGGTMESMDYTETCAVLTQERTEELEGILHDMQQR